MTRYRTHRQLLADSMETVVEVASLDDLVRHMREQVEAWYPPDELPTVENIKVEPYYGYDERIGWNTYIVTVNGSAWGFTDGPLEKKPGAEKHELRAARSSG